MRSPAFSFWSAGCYVLLLTFSTFSFVTLHAAEVAVEALIAGGGSEGRAAVRRLLQEDAPFVRLRAALALGRAGEREGVSVLIDLLPLLTAGLPNGHILVASLTEQRVCEMDRAGKVVWEHRNVKAYRVRRR